MANVIIFTDRSPDTRDFTTLGWSNKMYNLPAGAYKVAAHLRERGYSVLVIPNCLEYSFMGLQEIVKNNSRDLLWVGVSTTFLTVKHPGLEDYKVAWQSDSNHIMYDNKLHRFGENASYFNSVRELAWGKKEMSLIGNWLKRAYNVPFMIGGAWVTAIKNGNLNDLDANCFIVSGKAELFVERLTAQRSVDKNVQPEYLYNNSDYDNHGYKFSKIHWQDHDFITADDWLPLEISRGCAFNCTYCDYDKKNSFDNYKNPDVLREELLYNYEKFGVTKYNLLDDLYNDSKFKVRELYDKVWSKLPFKAEWTSFLRLDLIWADPESADILKASGARVGSFGIETLHDRAGKKVGKGLGRDRIIKTLERLKTTWGTDTLVSAMFITGLPFEPRESQIETIEWAHKTDLVYSFQFTPMWITPPSHFSFVNSKNKISEDNEKYQITWISHNNWINSEGITFQEADQLAKLGNSKKPFGMTANHGSYPDFRSAGLSHEDIIKMKTDQESMTARLNECNIAKTRKVNERIDKVLNLQGI
jgi:hypothetical protein